MRVGKIFLESKVREKKSGRKPIQRVVSYFIFIFGVFSEQVLTVVLISSFSIPFSIRSTRFYFDPTRSFVGIIVPFLLPSSAEQDHFYLLFFPPKSTQHSSNHGRLDDNGLRAPRCGLGC